MMTSGHHSERALPERRDISWLPPGAVMQTVLTSQIPPRELITSVFGLSFLRQDLLAIEHETRATDVPGGHIEPGESPVEALVREFREEGCATVTDAEVIGHIRITINGPQPAEYKYPYPTSYMVAFAARVERLDPFEARFETTGRKLLSPNESRNLTWVQENRELYERALLRVGR